MLQSALIGFILLAMCVLPQPARAQDGPPPGGVPRGGACDACDINCDSIRDIQDVAAFADLLVDSSQPCDVCTGDLDTNGLFDGADVQPFVECLLVSQPLGACCLDAATCTIATESACVGLWLGDGTTCDINTCSFANLTAYRPQHGGGYFPFTKTAVLDVDEENALTGPGIRINVPGDLDPSGEDDLIELLIESSRPEIPLTLARTHTALRLWTTRTKIAGTEIAFISDETPALTLSPGSSSLTLWAEWGESAHGNGEIQLKPLAADYALDVVRFHAFEDIVMSLGGEGQVTTVPVDPNNGTFVVGIALYEQGFDVHMYDEDNVAADGSGAVYNEVVTAVRDRGVSRVAIFGYSHGGGSTYDLAERLDVNRPGIGIFEIVGTSYADAVENDSDIDVQQELRRPPSTAYHANHYQVGTLTDFFLDGGPVPNSNPSPTGLNIETTPWGAGSTHFTVDDYVQVRSYIEANLATRLLP